MRLTTFATTALAAALLPSLGAAQEDYVTSVSTYTVTRTVERVVETTYATMSSAPPASTSVDTELPHEPTFSSVVSSASMVPLPQYNGTKPALGSGTGALPTSTGSMSSALPQATGNAAVRTETGILAAAVVGLVGLVAL